MSIARFIQRKVERLLGPNVLAWAGRGGMPQTARFCAYGHAVYSGNSLCSYGHRAA